MNTVAPAPEWVDARAAKQIFSLSKSTLYRLAGSGKITAVSLREEGRQRGKRLFSCASIRNFLESQAAG